MLRPGGTAFVSTPNLLTLAPDGAEKSGNPWHVKEYRAEEFRALCERRFDASRSRPLPRAQAAGCTSWRDRARLGRRPPELGITKPFYDWFMPAISARTSRCAPAPLDRALDFVAVLR